MTAKSTKKPSAKKTKKLTLSRTTLKDLSPRGDGPKGARGNGLVTRLGGTCSF